MEVVFVDQVVSQFGRLGVEHGVDVVNGLFDVGDRVDGRVGEVVAADLVESLQELGKC